MTERDTTEQKRRHINEGIVYAGEFMSAVNRLRDLNLRRVTAGYTSEEYTQELINTTPYGYLTPEELERGMLALATVISFADNPANSIRNGENETPIPLIYDIMRLLP